MSNYSSPTRHPVTGAIEMAEWLDDHDGKHRYGVRFPSDGKIYGGHECVEVRMTDDTVARLRGYCDGNNDLMDAAADEIERLRVTMDVLLADRRATLSENHDLWREIERMRSVLRRIAHAPHGKIYCADGHEEAVLIARAALAVEKTNDAAT